MLVPIVVDTISGPKLANGSFDCVGSGDGTGDPIEEAVSWDSIAGVEVVVMPGDLVISVMFLLEIIGGSDGCALGSDIFTLLDTEG